MKRAERATRAMVNVTRYPALARRLTADDLS
jgi:hypothetical protein